MIKFKNPQIAYLIKREKRFITYMLLDKKEIQVYCPNPGKMIGLTEKNTKCLISEFQPNKFQWEAAFVEDTWVGTNTQNPPKILTPLLKDLFPQQNFIKEKFVHKNYRADFVSENYIIEVKNVHWKIGDIAYFPDCITARGSKQIQIMSSIEDKQCYLIYILQRNDVFKLSVADFIDKKYAQIVKGVKNLKILAFNCIINLQGIEKSQQIEYIF